MLEIEEFSKYIYGFLDRDGEFKLREENIETLIKLFKLDRILAEQMYNNWKESFMKAKYKMSEV